MEHLPSLALQILAGPRKGETLQFRPESTIKIGRVIRGNTLPIKDSGISTKHLSIQIESGNWILTDLDSSNGTVLDGNHIPPNTPFHLRDGSTIKIGEVTSIVVNFVKPQNNPTCTEVEDKPIRGKRGNNNKGCKVRVPVKSIDENAIVSDGNDSDYVDRPEPARVTRNPRSTRSGVVSDSADGNLDAVEEKVEEPKNVRVTRNSKNKKNAVEICGSSIGNSEAPEEKVEELKNVRVTRNLRNKLNKMGISESSIGDLDAVKEKAEEGPRNGRVTRNAKNKGVVIEENSSLVDGVENVVKKKTRGGAKGNKKLQEECVGEGDGKENCDEKEKENLNGDDNWPDLTKMTLGEWFDFMEVYLPKKINDETEAIIDSMRQKAERLRQYVIMYENQKA
ncbi:FHA domain-containing protein At4g14490-like [Trifolium pratense]|uniref:FHA domain-containing protein At4g14490-like n=1 Tax=Trifolium pratense TaxID=57577 RepID=UPI001E69136F|nr:FHA domain-containing protein At4g14490-like [Trifolium pratense]